MKVEEFVKILGANFFTGVPDSRLKALCNYLYDTYGTDPKHHIIAANEGNSVGIAAGYHLATGKTPVVYLQNSGEGNIINPVASLLHKKVYAIPVIFVIGWRGEPGVHDEPQHIFQGEITLKLLDDLEIDHLILDKDSDPDDVIAFIEKNKDNISSGGSIAFVVREKALKYDSSAEYKNDYQMLREDILKEIVKISARDPIISTTGKTSRELFEIREALGHSHEHDFLTVGSMGHSSSIALGVALKKPDEKIWCVDGDGGALMHLGAMATIGSCAPENLVHIVINNEAHESVGGQPTAAGKIDLCKIAEGCGYQNVVCIEDPEALMRELEKAKKENGLRFIEIKSAIGSRSDLGRPTTTTIENKEAFIHHLNEHNK